MSYKHVEDSKDKPRTMYTTGLGVTMPVHPTLHSVWRCENCKSLCVTQKGSTPPPACGLCKR